MGLLRPCAEFKRLLVFSIAIVGGLLVAQWGMASLVPQQSMTLETIGARVHTEGLSSPIRMRFWNEAWMMLRSAPVFGIGFKQFAEKEDMRLWRAESLNGSPLLISALADIAKSRLEARVS